MKYRCMLNSEQNDEECDARDDDSSTAVDPIKKVPLQNETLFFNFEFLL